MDRIKFPNLRLPDASLKVDCRKGQMTVYDILRRKMVALTPEEYVRQHFINWLCNYLHYPPSLMANEKGITLNGTSKRCDTVVYKNDGSLLMIIEYKAPNVNITQNVFDQIVRYNMALRADYLIISNGINHYCCTMDYERGTYFFLKNIPDYSTLL